VRWHIRSHESGALQASSYRMRTGKLSQGVKLPKLEAVHLPSSCVEFNNTLSFMYIPPLLRHGWLIYLMTLFQLYWLHVSMVVWFVNDIVRRMRTVTNVAYLIKTLSRHLPGRSDNIHNLRWALSRVSNAGHTKYGVLTTPLWRSECILSRCVA
jgi:hypothetical protein